jgi:ELWxxDGT repeat protein
MQWTEVRTALATRQWGQRVVRRGLLIGVLGLGLLVPVTASTAATGDLRVTQLKCCGVDDGNLSAQVGEYGDQLMFLSPSGRIVVTDGTPEGTVDVADGDTNYQTSQNRPVVEYDDMMFFSEQRFDGDEFRYALRKTAGTPESTEDVVSCTSVSPVNWLTPAGGWLYFSGTCGPDTVSNRVHRTDGTTVEIVNSAGTFDQDPEDLIDLNGTLLYSGVEFIIGRELLAIVPEDFRNHRQEINATAGEGGGTNSSDPRDLVRVGDLVLFSADDGTHGRELWVTDGIVDLEAPFSNRMPGTVMLKDIVEGEVGSNPRDLVTVGDTVYFSAEDPVHGRELWKSDGTPEGTMLVKDMGIGAGGSDPQELTDADDGEHLFFAADTTGSHELWISDGTPEGTHLVNAAPSMSEFFDLPFRYWVAIDGTVFFEGGGLWQSDGTAEGTRATGYDGGVYLMSKVRGSLYFTGRRADEPGGSEGVYRLDVAPKPTAIDSSVPVGPADDNAPRLIGTAPSNAETVSIYGDAACGTTPLAEGTVAEFTTTGLQVSVPDNSETSFWVTTGNGGGESDCSASPFVFTEVTDVEVTGFKVKAAKKQKPKGKKLALVATVKASEKIVTTGTGKIKIKGTKGALKFKKLTRTVVEGQPVTLKFTVRNKGFERKLRVALRQYRQASGTSKSRIALVATLKVRGVDLAGNVVKRTLKISLR